ncbi:ATP-dependent Clp protease proteolytic subunit [Kosakonia phage Kc263]|uniref:ATP-dependent Clp protease proteolytic subunit n=1 Tax=Kosakonia phage Kc263 TaxID=2863194 RepID=A0AAE8BEF3_9CAUD|nr:ATP-dependent Clp protease proteolytic subunit [Kosakonia phage Kc263]QYN79910.1 ATP-dependent Clp protease proteolytic subunit [Kosakonia phage Kc263]
MAGINVIVLNGGFTKDTIEKFYEQLDRSRPGPFVVQLFGQGGSVNMMLTVADILRSFDVPVTVISRGANASANVRMPLTSDFIRLCYDSSTFLFHATRFRSEGSIEEVEHKYKKNLESSARKVNDFMEQVGVTKRQAEKYNGKEFTLNAEEALMTGTKGIVDGIIVKDFRDGKFIIRTRDGLKQIDATIHRRGDIAKLPIYKAE